MLAGDAAHLMPVWLGQGWNSGIRDATNLSWKLTAVLDGDASDTLLDTYTEERRQHAIDMIDVNMATGTVMKLKPFGGDWWTLATWGTDPTAYLSPADLDLLRRHRVRLVSFMPETQRPWAEKQYADSPLPVTVVGDTSGVLKAWFDVRACGLVVLRPDRFVAAASLTQQASQTLAAVATAASLTASTPGTVTGPVQEGGHS